MVISLQDYRMPNWVKMRTRYPYSDVQKDIYIQASDADMARAYPRGIRLPGYDSVAKLPKMPKINLMTESLVLRTRG